LVKNKLGVLGYGKIEVDYGKSESIKMDKE